MTPLTVDRFRELAQTSGIIRGLIHLVDGEYKYKVEVSFYMIDGDQLCCFNLAWFTKSSAVWDFNESPLDQLWNEIGTLFTSWMSNDADLTAFMEYEPIVLVVVDEREKHHHRDQCGVSWREVVDTLQIAIDLLVKVLQAREE
jgi:hypothetical protein